MGTTLVDFDLCKFIDRLVHLLLLLSLVTIDAQTCPILVDRVFHIASSTKINNKQGFLNQVNFFIPILYYNMLSDMGWDNFLNSASAFLLTSIFFQRGILIIEGGSISICDSSSMVVVVGGRGFLCGCRWWCLRW